MTWRRCATCPTTSGSCTSASSSSRPADKVYGSPAHPYTKGLIDAAPVADPQAEKAKVRAGVAAELPSAITPPSLCRFRTRCPFAQDRCAEEEPLLRSFGPAHFAACHFPLISPAPEAAVTSSAVTAATTAEGEQESQPDRVLSQHGCGCVTPLGASVSRGIQRGTRRVVTTGDH